MGREARHGPRPASRDEGPRVRRPDRVLRDHLPEGAHDGAEGRDSRDPRAVGHGNDAAVWPRLARRRFALPGSSASWERLSHFPPVLATNGTVITYQGVGHQYNVGVQQGDVKLMIVTLPHAHFVRRGADLVYTHKLDG